MKNRQLDPKLRRLMQASDDSVRLRADLDRGRLTAADDLDAATAEVTPQGVTSRVLVRLSEGGPPDGFADLRWNKIVDGIYAVAVPMTRLEELADAASVQYVEAGKELAPMLSSSVAETGADQVHTGAPGLRGAGVVVGLVDLGFDYTLDDFRNPDGSTRVAFLWDQALTANADEQAPTSFGYGVEYDATAIDAALNTADPFATVRHTPSAEAHGTHVAGIAAGNGRSADGDFAADAFVGTAPEATIIFVNPAANDQTTTFTDSVHVAEAVAYIFQKADELGLPCVINMSLGQNGGSHDGESVVERAIDRLLEKPGRAMTLAGGNEHVWRGHASGQIDTGATRTLGWRVGGGMPLPGGNTLGLGFDFTSNEMEVWYSSRDNFRVRLISPQGEASPDVEVGESSVHGFASGEIAFIDSERFTVLNGDARIYIEVSRIGGVVSSGTWSVQIESVESRDGRFDAWIERDARRSSNNFADQSFFLGTDFDGVKTLGTPATGRRALAVANYDHVTMAPSISSGRGTTRDGREKPEIAAPGTRIVSSNALGGANHPANPGAALPVRVSKSGTSMAAPHVAGIAALLFALDPRLSAEQVRKILVASADPPAGVEPFDIAWGFGRVRANDAVDLLESS